MVAAGLIEEHGAQVLVAPPVQLRRLLAAELTAPASLRATVSGAAPLPVELHQALVATIGDILYNLYDTTEAGWAALATPGDLRAAPAPWARHLTACACWFATPRARCLLPGRSARCMSAAGYAGRRGGHRGRRPLDPVGRLTLHGCVDRMIVSGGVTVHPERVEAMLALHPEEFRQRLAAQVRLHPGATLTPDDLRDWLRERLPPAQRPRGLLISESSNED